MSTVPFTEITKGKYQLFPSGVPRLSKVKEKSPIGLVTGLYSRRHCLDVIAQFHYSWTKRKMLRQ